MALSDLTVYSETAYSAMTEVLDQQIELFNAATGGCIQLTSAAVQGDFSETAFWKKVSGLVRRRNAYGSGTVTAKKLENLVDVMVKVAAGTPPIQIDPGQFTWIQQNPELAGAILGQQLAGDTMADMLNIAIGCGYAALSQVTALVTDITGVTAPGDIADFGTLTTAAGKFGDRSSDIAAWVMHSTPMTNLYLNNLANAENLFRYETVNVVRDPFGRLMIQTDSANLVASTVYRILGLVPGAIMVSQNNDWMDNTETTNGDENILRTWQAEWTYNLAIKGFAWDKANGGKSPTDAALLTSSNWDKYATSNKDTAGVVVKTH